METFALAAIAFGILSFGLISGRAQTSIVTPPMVFVLYGLAIGPAGLSWASFDIDHSLVHLLAELTLVVILFTDASRIDVKLCYYEQDLPLRLLAIGMPLTIIAGAVVGVAVFAELGFWQAAVLAAILAPTDAALGQAVVSSPQVPPRIRQALNVESGLNDGIALPVILILLSIVGAGHGEGAQSVAFWIQFAGKQVILGPIAGLVVGYVGTKLLERAWNSGWMNEVFLKLSTLGLALLAFAVAELIGGNGFIAAFVAGLTMGNSARSICPRLYEFGEAEGQLLALLTFLIFGAVMVPEASHVFNVWILVYAVLSLTVVRMAPVAIALTGAGLKPVSVLFIGWFGPRGIASILFGLLVLEETGLPGSETIMAVVVTTVLISVFAHGVTAYPGTSYYAEKLNALKQKPRTEEPEMAEHRPVTEMPVRLGHTQAKALGK
ncbi:MAG: cation:proton antiporter [Gammaproteobacteria bacterium]